MVNDHKSGGSSSSSNSAKKGKNKSSSSGNNTDKPKQPQRGLGVAQLEKIRIHHQMASNGFFPHPHHPGIHGPFPHPPFQHVHEEMRMQAAGYHQAALQASVPPFGYSSPIGSSVPSYGYHPDNYMMAMGDHMERINTIRYGDPGPPRWNSSNNMVPGLETHPYVQPQGLVTKPLLSNVEQNNSRNSSFESKPSSSQNSETSENEDLDLELRL